MNSELPDLEPLSPSDEMALREGQQFTRVLLGGGILAPWLLIVLSLVSGNRLWLTGLNLVGMYAGLWVMFEGWRHDNQRRVRLGGAGMALSLALCLILLSVLQ